MVTPTTAATATSALNNLRFSATTTNALNNKTNKKKQQTTATPVYKLTDCTYYTPTKSITAPHSNKTERPPSKAGL